MCEACRYIHRFCHLGSILYLLIHQISYCSTWKSSRGAESRKSYTHLKLYSPLHRSPAICICLFWSFVFGLLVFTLTSSSPSKNPPSCVQNIEIPSSNYKCMLTHRLFFFLRWEGPGNWDHKPPAPHLENCLIRWNRLAPSNGSYLLSCSSQLAVQCIGEKGRE